MTKSFAVDDNNDIFIDETGNLAIGVGLDAVVYACKNAAQTVLGEMIYQTNQGMPNFQTIWKGSPNISQFQASLTATLLAVADVIEVPRINAKVVNNVLQYSAVIVTTYGSDIVTGEI